MFICCELDADGARTQTAARDFADGGRENAAGSSGAGNHLGAKEKLAWKPVPVADAPKGMGFEGCVT